MAPAVEAWTTCHMHRDTQCNHPLMFLQNAFTKDLPMPASPVTNTQCPSPFAIVSIFTCGNCKNLSLSILPFIKQGYDKYKISKAS